MLSIFCGAIIQIMFIRKIIVSLLWELNINELA